ncbi:MAG: HD domain-containing protein [Firmicutes bacterium]|nr:HD domain-containing protein [Bacillota bacterium]
MQPSIHRHHYTLLVALVLADAAAAAWLWDPSVLLAWPLWALVALTAVAEALPVELPQGRGSVSVSFPLIFTSSMVLGPFAGFVVGLLGTLTADELRGRVPWLRMALNHLQLALAGAVSGLAYVSLERLWGSPLGVWTGLLAGGLLYFIVNAGSVSLMVSLYHRMSVLHYFKSSVLGTVPNYLALIPISYVMASVYQSLGVAALAVFFLPLLVARQSFKLYSEMRQSYREMIVALTRALEAKDPYTAGHAERVSGIAVHLGKVMEMPEEDLEILEIVGLLHDIGKIAVPDSILNKRGRLTPEEYALMKKHPVTGHEIVRNIHFLGKGQEWVLHHHEHWDGRGYPDGLAGEAIPLGARVLSIADAADAMLSDRPYRRAMRLIEACRQLARASGEQYDPTVLRRFFELCADERFAKEILRQPAPISAAELGELIALPEMAAARREAAAARPRDSAPADGGAPEGSERA